MCTDTLAKFSGTAVLNVAASPISPRRSAAEAKLLPLRMSWPPSVRATAVSSLLAVKARRCIDSSPTSALQAKTARRTAGTRVFRSVADPLQCDSVRLPARLAQSDDVVRGSANERGPIAARLHDDQRKRRVSGMLSLPVCKSRGKMRLRIASEVPKADLQQSLNRSRSPSDLPKARLAGFRLAQRYVRGSARFLLCPRFYRRLSQIGAGKGTT